jgi:hypothetical protein
MKFRETALKEIIQARLGQIFKISISTFKLNIFKTHSFCLVSEDPRSQIILYRIFLLKCNH